MRPFQTQGISAAGRYETGKTVMVRVAYISLMTGLFCALPQAQIRVAQIGSNPFLSAELFPQDMQQWPTRGFMYSPTYAKLPYWGRIDDPLARPNANYTSTGLTTENFSHTAKVYSVTNDFSYTHNFSPRLFMLAGLNLDVDARYNTAEGLLHAHNDSGKVVGSALPFDYSMLNALGSGKITYASAFLVKGIATGVRLTAGVQNTAKLSHSLSFTKDSVTYHSDRATWGWTTSPCAHVFGLKNPEGDTWLQSDYAVGPLYSIDLQVGATLPLGKSGIRFSLLSGHQDYYQWRTDSSAFGVDSIINGNFVGHYDKQQWSRTTSGMTIQLYTDYVVRKHESFTLSLFSRIGYNGLTYGEALSNNLDIARDDEESIHGVSLDIAPNLTIPFGSLFSYIDVAIPLQYGYARRSNTYMRWVGGGQTRTYWDTRTSNEDENIWEPFSYADQHDLGAGVDFSTMFPLTVTPRTQLGLGLQLLINFCATFTNKSYGSNVDKGSTVDFSVEQKRYDYEGRKQFASGVKLQYQSGRTLAWFEITEPLLQAVRPVTKVTDASGNNVSYEHEKSPLWLSMQGMRFSLFYTYQMTIPWLSKFDTD